MMRFNVTGMWAVRLAAGVLAGMCGLLVAGAALSMGRSAFEAIGIGALAVALGISGWLLRRPMQERGIWWLVASFALWFSGFWMLFGVSIEPAQGIALVASLFIAGTWMFVRGINRFWRGDDRG